MKGIVKQNKLSFEENETGFYNSLIFHDIDIKESNILISKLDILFSFVRVILIVIVVIRINMYTVGLMVGLSVISLLLPKIFKKNAKQIGTKKFDENKKYSSNTKQIIYGYFDFRRCLKKYVFENLLINETDSFEENMYQYKQEEIIIDGMIEILHTFINSIIVISFIIMSERGLIGWGYIFSLIKYNSYIYDSFAKIINSQNKINLASDYCEKIGKYISDEKMMWLKMMMQR